jgi:hypothetical protein
LLNRDIKTMTARDRFEAIKSLRPFDKQIEISGFKTKALSEPEEFLISLVEAAVTSYADDHQWEHMGTDKENIDLIWNQLNSRMEQKENK